MIGARAIAALALLAGATGALAEGAPAPTTPSPAGSLIGPALHVTDVNRALRFYVDGLGMNVLMSMGPPERHETMLGFGKDPRQPGIILLSDDTGAAPAPVTHGHGYDRVVMRLADLDTTSARLTAAGFAPSPIREVTMGYRMMLASDPDGYRLELVQSPKPPQGAPK